MELKIKKNGKGEYFVYGPRATSRYIFWQSIHENPLPSFAAAVEYMKDHILTNVREDVVCFKTDI